MIDLLVRGGLWFTLPLTVIAFAVVVAAGWAGHALMTGRGTGAFGKRMVFHLGLFGLVLGLLGQSIALYEAMAAIEAMGSVSPALLAGGLRVSLIAPMYGLGIFTTALLCWLALHLVAKNAAPPEMTPRTGVERGAASSAAENRS